MKKGGERIHSHIAVSSGWGGGCPVPNCPAVTSTLSGWSPQHRRCVSSSPSQTRETECYFAGGNEVRGDKKLAQDHPAIKGQSHDWNQGSLTSRIFMLMLCHTHTHTHTHTALGWAAWNPIRNSNVSKEPASHQPHAHQPMLMILRITWYFYHTQEQSWPRFLSLLTLQDSAPRAPPSSPGCTNNLLQVSVPLYTCTVPWPGSLPRALGGLWAQLTEFQKDSLDEQMALGQGCEGAPLGSSLLFPSSAS